MHRPAARRRFATLAASAAVAATPLLAGCGAGGDKADAATPGDAPAGSALPPGFGGRGLLTISDADMVATAYTQGDLGPAAGRDQLSLLTLSGASKGTIAVAPVSNSVVAQPAAVAVAPGGKLSATVETTGQRTRTSKTLEELPDGSQLTLASLDSGTPEVLQTLTFPEHPETADFSPDGRTLAVSFGPEERRKLALIPVEGDRLGTPVFVGLPGVELPAEATRAAQVDWHPSSRFLGVTLPGLGQEAFFEVADDRRSVKPHGKPIDVGETPFMGRFTPDGRHFVVTNTQWNLGEDAPVGIVAATRFDRERPGRTRVVSEAKASYGPEGLTISPDGRRVITNNIEFSANPPGDELRTEYTSVSLFELDPASGRLEHADTVYDDAVLTESAAVDTTGTWVATTNFQRRDKPGEGALKYWRIVDDRNSRGPKLVATAYSTPLPRGPHTVALVP